MKGRPPTPIAQREREGNPSKRPLPATVELQAVEGLEPPQEIPPAGVKLWQEIVPILSAANLLNLVDRAALTALCIQWARGVEAREFILDEGYFSLGAAGQIVEHPALGMERKAHAMLLRFCEHYGLTPVARARIAATLDGRRSVEDDLSFDAEVLDES